MTGLLFKRPHFYEYHDFTEIHGFTEAAALPSSSCQTVNTSMDTTSATEGLWPAFPQKSVCNIFSL